MKDIKKFMMVLPVFILISLLCSSSAYAWFWGGDGHGRGRGYPRYERYPYGTLEMVLPHGCIAIGFGGHRYFYNAGLFYLESDHRYVVVPPPAGVVVYGIPDGWHQVVIDGVLYYTYNGIYYTRVPQGYQVVQPPTQVIVEQATVTANLGVDQPQQEFTVNIPNSRGGYVPVLIKKFGNGFVGPQGEFYAEFPKVAHLQAMYGRGK